MGRVKISDYDKLVGKDVVNELRFLAYKLKGKTIQCINSTRVGGGVAEILSRLIPLLNDLGVDARWDVIEADNAFFNITKSFHNALHGNPSNITVEMYKEFERIGDSIIEGFNLYGDIIFVHDPQPIFLIKRKYQMDSKWIWRCHVDVSNPDRDVWLFLRKFIEEYDSSVFSAPQFARQLNNPQFLISPSIDPFSDKNRPLTQSEIKKVLKKYGIDKKKPMITQVSRYDYLKDPVGVIEAYRLVKKYIDCQLVLAGNKAADDPEMDKVLAEVKEKAGNDPDIHILIMDPIDTDVNAIQSASDVIVQKSIKEGFALTVTEALWKEKPVVASYVGGIPLQITHKYSGLLCRTIGGCAMEIRQLLNNPEYGKVLGKNGKEHVKRNFISTRHLRDYMLLFLYLYRPEDIISLYEHKI